METYRYGKKLLYNVDASPMIPTPKSRNKPSLNEIVPTPQENQETSRPSQFSSFEQATNMVNSENRTFTEYLMMFRVAYRVQRVACTRFLPHFLQLFQRKAACPSVECGDSVYHSNGLRIMSTTNEVPRTFLEMEDEEPDSP